MLDTAEKLQKVFFRSHVDSILIYLLKHVDLFVMRLVEEEKDRMKQQKLMDLQLTKDEWEQVSSFLKLLAVRVLPFFAVFIEQ